MPRVKIEKLIDDYELEFVTALRRAIEYSTPNLENPEDLIYEFKRRLKGISGWRRVSDNAVEKS